MAIQLGDKVKDPITGITGIAVARTILLHGCARIAIQPHGVDKDGKPFDTFSADEPQLEIVAPKKIKKGSNDMGGPRMEVYQKKNMAIKHNHS